LPGAAVPSSVNKRQLLVGSYTRHSGGHGAGISAWELDLRTGHLEQTAQLALASPSWLTPHPRLPLVYSVNETDDGGVTVFGLKGLQVLAQASSGGMSPCHLEVSSDGHWLACANYLSGSVALFVLRQDGALSGLRYDLAQHGSGPDPDRQDRSYLHMATFSPASDVVTAVDLGADQLSSYALETGRPPSEVSRTSLPRGTGPRQLVRLPGQYAVVVGELSSKLVLLSEARPGQFHVVSEAPVSGHARSAANPEPAHLLPSGGGVLVSNRSSSTLSNMALVNDKLVLDWELELDGAYVRHFALESSWLLLADQRGDRILALPWPLSGPTEFVETPVGSPAFILPIGPPRARPVAPGRVVLAAEAHVCRGWRV
jgi:6-phosphogluconolactonase (cycloisomerase 2 family)